MFVYDRTGAASQIGVLLVDVAAFAILLVLALRSTRYWPLFAAGFHFLAVVTHGARLIDQTVGAWAYVTAEIIWGYLLVGALAVGVWGRIRSPRPA